MEQVCREDRRVRLLCHSGRYTPISRNLGTEHSRGEYVAFVDAHSEVDREWIPAVMRAIEEHPEVWGVGGVLQTEAEGPVGKAISIAQSSPIGVGNSRFRTGGAPGYVDTVVFGAYRRDVFARIGRFDEEMIRNQDDEFNIRILAAGGRLYFDPRIRCRYFARNSFGRLWRQYYQYGFWKVRVREKTGRLGSWRQYVPGAFVAGGFLSCLLDVVAGGAGVLASGYLALYGLVLLMGSLRATGPRVWLWAPVGIAAAVMHLAYGLGFWEGILRWKLLGGRTQERHRALTR